MKRVFLLLVLLSLLWIGTGCTSSESPDSPSPSPTVLSDDTVLTVNGLEVSEMEFKYQLFAMFDAYTYYGGSEIAWNEPIDDFPADEFFKEQVANSVVLYRLVELYANDLGLTLSEEEQAGIDEAIQVAINEAGGEAPFREQLEAIGLSDALFRYIMTGPELYYKIFQHLYGDGGRKAPLDSDVSAYYYEHYIGTRHIMLLLSDEEGNPLDDAAVSEKRALMEQISAELNAGAEFGRLMDTYNEDTGINGLSLCFGPGEMPEEYYAAASALEEHSTSDILEMLGTLCIIERQPLEDSYLADNFSAIREQCAVASFDALLGEQKQQAEIVRTARYDALDVQALYEQYKTTP